MEEAMSATIRSPLVAIVAASAVAVLFAAMWNRLACRIAGCCP
jgi:hypothetical protein